MSRFGLSSALLFLFPLQLVIGQPAGFHCLTEQLATGSRQVRLRSNLQRLRSPSSLARKIQYVPLRFHLVGKNDGSGRIAESSVLRQFQRLNRDFDGTGIQFFLQDGFSHLNHAPLYHNPLYAASKIHMHQHFEPHAINIFITQAAAAGAGGFYDGQNDWIVLTKDEVNKASHALAHEIGHFFSLAHTHYGWDHEPWRAAKHGNPAPEIAPLGIPTERQDGSNCSEAGDFICDTPPDYNGNGWPDCHYRGGALDPAGAPIDPDESNIMSYFRHCDRRDYHFSRQQKRVMIEDLNSPSRRRLHNLRLPVWKEIAPSPELIAPADQSTQPPEKPLQLRWTAVAGAKAYLVELRQSSLLGEPPRQYIVRDTLLEIPNDFAAGIQFTWRVYPFNGYQLATPSDSSCFKTLQLTTSNREINRSLQLLISPNPVPKGQPLRVHCQAGRTGQAEFQIFSIHGLRLRRYSYINLPTGAKNPIQLEIGNLQAGNYILTVRSPGGVGSQKFVVSP